MLEPHDAGQQTSAGVPEPVARRQLERILASDTFSRSERLTQFLRFIVERNLEGRASELKEQVLACELYGRSTDFNAAADPAVRVDARRLRDKLREYYTEFPDDPVVITVPRGGYVPAFEWSRREPPPLSVPVQTPSADDDGSRLRSKRVWMVVYGAATAATLCLFVWLWSPDMKSTHKVPIPLTFYPGDERWPSLSPDGEFIAFGCSGAHGPQSGDICVKALGSESIRRVVATPEAESRPAWSPDGRKIAFARAAGGKELGIFIVPLIGGAERRISETGTAVHWHPDGNSVLIRDRVHAEPSPFAVFEVELDSLHRRRVTHPSFGGGDWAFEVSPDGKTLAFIRYQRPGVSDLYVMPLQGGETQRLTNWNAVLDGIAWTPDGRELVYGVNDRLWRISARGTQPGRGSPISSISVLAGHPSISRVRGERAAKLAFHTPQVQITLRKIDLRSVGADGIFRVVAAFAPATRKDIPGAFSPDGSFVAFTSTRGSPDHELWVSDANGAHPRQLTFLGPNSLMMAHAWSPDGARILFEAAVDGNSDLYVIPAEGGKTSRLTSDSAIEGLAHWSRDGRWIYYTKVATGMNAEIWRMPAEGGAGARITTTGGSVPQESPDGRYIYYVDRPPLAGRAGRLMRTPARGGEVETVLDGVLPFYWSVADTGIYFLKDQGNRDSIQLYRFANEKVERAGILPFRVAHFPQTGRLSVSRDGLWALVSVTDRAEGDVMLLDEFR